MRIARLVLINILLGLLSPSSGKILADDEDIKYNIDNWQKKIGYIPQEVYLLDANIRENIALGVDEKEIDQKNLPVEIEIGLSKYIQFV